MHTHSESWANPNRLMRDTLSVYDDTYRSYDCWNDDCHETFLRLCLGSMLVSASPIRDEID